VNSGRSSYYSRIIFDSFYCHYFKNYSSIMYTCLVLETKCPRFHFYTQKKGYTTHDVSQNVTRHTEHWNAHCLTLVHCWVSFCVWEREGVVISFWFPDYTDHLKGYIWTKAFNHCQFVAYLQPTQNLGFQNKMAVGETPDPFCSPKYNKKKK